MRSLWPAIGVSALVAGCGRPNPGFQLLESGGASATEVQSSSVGSTDPGVVTAGVTSVDASTAVTGSEGSMSGSTDDTGSTTTPVGMKFMFPTDCAEPTEKSGWVEAVADTFFLNEAAAGPCDLNQQSGAYCQNMEFSRADAFQLFRQLDENDLPQDDYMSIYAVRFAMPKVFYMGVEVPEDAFIKAEARIRVSRPALPAPWEPVQFAVHRFADGDFWAEGTGDKFIPCFAPAASYRCQVCPADNAVMEGDCSEPWAHDFGPYDTTADPVLSPVVKVEPVGEGFDVPLWFTGDDLNWLTGDGLMLVPVSETLLNTIEVKTLDYPMQPWHPALQAYYCTPIPI